MSNRVRFCPAMQQVKHRIAHLRILVIARRRVDHGPSPLLRYRGEWMSLPGRSWGRSSSGARNTLKSKTREFAGKLAHPRPEKTRSLPNEFEQGAKLLCHRPIIGLCVEKLWEAIVSLMHECSPHNIIKPDLVWFQIVRSPSVWGLFRPASRVPHRGGCVACRNVRRKRSKRTKVWGEQRGVAQKRLRFVSNFSAAGERLGKVTKLGAR
jgi:hypothetical protein